MIHFPIITVIIPHAGLRLSHFNLVQYDPAVIIKITRFEHCGVLKNKYADETRDRVAKKRIKAAGGFLVKLGQKSDESVSSGEPAALNPHGSPADGAQRQAGAPGARHRAHATISIWSLPRIRDGDYLKQHLFLFSAIAG